MGVREVESFLTMLATERHVSPSTHKQALCAILFLYKEVLQIELPWMEQIGRPKTQQRLPVVFTKLEVQSILQELNRTHIEYGLFASLLYGTGMRIVEAARLRIKDISIATYFLNLAIKKSNQTTRNRHFVLASSTPLSI